MTLEYPRVIEDTKVEFNFLGERTFSDTKIRENIPKYLCVMCLCLCKLKVDSKIYVEI